MQGKITSDHNLKGQTSTVCIIYFSQAVRNTTGSGKRCDVWHYPDIFHQSSWKHMQLEQKKLTKSRDWFFHTTSQQSTQKEFIMTERAKNRILPKPWSLFVFCFFLEKINKITKLNTNLNKSFVYFIFIFEIPHPTIPINISFSLDV